MERLRRLMAALRATPDEGECAESCLEAMCDPERARALGLGEHEEAAIEAERRRWESLHETPRGA
jgi:hypothetical protein